MACSVAGLAAIAATVACNQWDTHQPLECVAYVEANASKAESVTVTHPDALQRSTCVEIEAAGIRVKTGEGQMWTKKAGTGFTFSIHNGGDKPVRVERAGVVLRRKAIFGGVSSRSAVPASSLMEVDSEYYRGDAPWRAGQASVKVAPRQSAILFLSFGRSIQTGYLDFRLVGEGNSFSRTYRFFFKPSPPPLE